MATDEQIRQALSELERVQPLEFFRFLDDAQVGMVAALRLLHEQSGAVVTAGKISSGLHISTARVAVLLRKMEAKGLITRERGDADARLTIVHLTALGEQTSAEIRRSVYRNMGIVLDAVGEERLMEFIHTAGDIQSALTPPDIHL